MKYFSLTILILLIFGCSNTKSTELKSSTKTTAARPNIIVILCDDLGYADVGFNGSKDIITPHLDQLATNGMVCSAGYVPHPFCGPSRAGLMTGRYPHTFGSQFNLMMNSGELIGEGIPLGEKFMSKNLQEAGYHTGIVGKWHLGAVPDYHPLKRGFDDFYGFLGGGHKYFPHQYQPLYQAQVEAGSKLINDYLKPLEHNHREVKETEYITDALSREAVRFVNDAAKNKKDPFFLYLAYNAPHSPLEAKEEDLAKFKDIKNKKRRTYAAMVYAVDRGVGRLVKALKANNNLENTLIVFFSDNGGKIALGANNFPLKEGKGSTNEGGFRVPMLFHYPKDIPAGSQYNHPVSALDFYPTFAHLAEAVIPKEKQLDGKNIWQDLISGNNSHQGEMIYALRHREGYSDVGARKDDWKVLKTKQKPWRLYHIKDDIGEQHDLSKQHPERVRQMVSEVAAWSKTHTEPRWFDPVELENDWKEKNMAEFGNTFQVED